MDPCPGRFLSVASPIFHDSRAHRAIEGHGGGDSFGHAGILQRLLGRIRCRRPVVPATGKETGAGGVAGSFDPAFFLPLCRRTDHSEGGWGRPGDITVLVLLRTIGLLQHFIAAFHRPSSRWPRFFTALLRPRDRGRSDGAVDALFGRSYPGGCALPLPGGAGHRRGFVVVASLYMVSDDRWTARIHPCLSASR